MATYTKGPWKTTDTTIEKTYLIKTDEDNKVIGSFEGSLGPKETEANIKLIAAAPELLDALTGLLDSYILYVKRPDDSQFVINARAALSKALN